MARRDGMGYEGGNEKEERKCERVPPPMLSHFTVSMPSTSLH